MLWRLRHRDGGRARATFLPGVPTSTLVFFMNDRFERGENVADWGPALKRADEVRRAMLEAGWEEDLGDPDAA